MQSATRTIVLLALLGFLASPCMAGDFAYTSTSGGTIADVGTINYTIDVPDSFIIDDLKVELSLAHTDLGDLEVTLSSPDGTTIHIWDRGCDDDSNIFAVLSDAGGRLRCDDTEPKIDVLVPPLNSQQAALSVFDGEDAQGTWTFTVTDHVVGDTGVLWATLLFHSDRIQPLVSMIKNDVTNIDNQTQIIDAKADAILNDLADLPAVQAGVDQIQTSLSILQSDVTELLNGQAMSQTVEVETNLLAKRYPVTYFIPQAQGGKLEFVRQVVANAIAQATAAGESTFSAANQLASGDSLSNNGRFKRALRKYAVAYCLAASRNNEVGDCS